MIMVSFSSLSLLLIQAAKRPIRQKQRPWVELPHEPSREHGEDGLVGSAGRTEARNLEKASRSFLDEFSKVLYIIFLSWLVFLLTLLSSCLKANLPKRSVSSGDSLRSASHGVYRRGGWRSSHVSSASGLSKTAHLRRESRQERFRAGIGWKKRTDRIFLFSVFFPVPLFLFSARGEGGAFVASAHALLLGNRGTSRPLFLLAENSEGENTHQQQRFPLLGFLRSVSSSPSLSPSSSTVSLRSSSLSTTGQTLTLNKSRRRRGEARRRRPLTKHPQRAVSVNPPGFLPGSSSVKKAREKVRVLLSVNLSVSPLIMRKKEKSGLSGPVANSSSLASSESPSLVMTSSENEENLPSRRREQKKQEGGGVAGSRELDESGGEGEEANWTLHSSPTSVDSSSFLSSSISREHDFFENDQSLSAYVTGFGPFVNVKNNPTACVAMNLQDVLLRYLAQREDLTGQKPPDLPLPSSSFSKFLANSETAKKSEALVSSFSPASALPFSSSHTHDGGSRCTYTAVISPLLTEEELGGSCSSRDDSSPSSTLADRPISSSSSLLTEKVENSIPPPEAPEENPSSLLSASPRAKTPGVPDTDVPLLPSSSSSARSRGNHTSAPDPHATSSPSSFLQDDQQRSRPSLWPPSGPSSPPPYFLSSSSSNISICGAEVLHVSARAVDEAVPRIFDFLDSFPSSGHGGGKEKNQAEMIVTKKKNKAQHQQQGGDEEEQKKTRSASTALVEGSSEPTAKINERTDKDAPAPQVSFLGETEDPDVDREQSEEKQDEEHDVARQSRPPSEPLPELLSRHTTTASADEEVAAELPLSSVESGEKARLPSRFFSPAVDEEKNSQDASAIPGKTSPGAPHVTDKRAKYPHKPRKLLLHLGLDAKAKTFALEERAFNGKEGISLPGVHTPGLRYAYM